LRTNRATCEVNLRRTLPSRSPLSSICYPADCSIKSLSPDTRCTTGSKDSGCDMPLLPR
jgi:hypothetical protein